MPAQQANYDVPGCRPPKSLQRRWDHVLGHQQREDVEREADRRNDADQPFDRGKGGLGSNRHNTHGITVLKGRGKPCMEETGPML